MYSSEDIAKIAARVFCQRLGVSMVRIRSAWYDAGAVRKVGEVTPKMDAEEALLRIENGF